MDPPPPPPVDPPDTGLSRETGPDGDLVARLRLASTPGLSPRILARLVRHLGSPERVLCADRGSLVQVPGVGRARADLVATAPGEEQVREQFGRLVRAGAVLVRPGTPGWPAGLDQLDDPPLLLYGRGELRPPDHRGVAIVGARRATTYGRRQAARLAGDLAALGITVISGLARGVDTAAHRGALDAGGRTVAVLGGGLARPYPPENVPLAREIAAGRGAVLSEFPPDVPPLPHHFPRRNRILAAMAAAVVVVEAGERSGSLITADHALDLGREVLAVPGRVDSETSRGAHALLREGPAICEGVTDVLRALGIELEEPAPDGGDPAPALDGVEGALITALAGTERFADDLVEEIDGDPADVLAALAALELSGTLLLGPDGRYGVA